MSQGARGVATTDLLPRPVRDDDSPALIALVGAAFAEHAGCVLDLDDLDSDLLAPASAAGALGGRWWVLGEHTGEVLATVGAGPPREGVVELKRLYVAASARGRGLGARLVAWVEAHAAGLGAGTLELWSDTRFTDAHRLYRRLGHRATGERRHLHDPSDTTELRFLADLPPTPPDRTVIWHGPHGPDTCRLVSLPDGRRLHGEVAGTTYEIEVDHARGVRRVEMQGPGRRLHLTSDGTGRWWSDGRRRDDLDGASTVDLEFTPAARTLALCDDATGQPTLVVVAHDLDVHLERVRCERTAGRRWRVRRDGADRDLMVDADGLLVDDGTWRAEGAGPLRPDAPAPPGPGGG